MQKATHSGLKTALSMVWELVSRMEKLSENSMAGKMVPEKDMARA